MKNLLKIILALRGCRHRWKVIREVNVMDLDVSKDIPAYRKYLLQCQRCGNVKNHKGA